MHKAIHICNSHQSTLQPKIAKEYVFANANRRPKKNTERTTRYIKNWADGAKLEVFSSHLTLCCLTVNRSEMPNFSYTQPLGATLRRHPRQQTNSKTTDKSPTLRKIKRAAMQPTSRHKLQHI